MTYQSDSPSAEVLAVIGLALTEALETHDSTDMRLTIRRPSVPSAWALKSQIVRTTPPIKEY